jgi:hypothetical protein
MGIIADPMIHKTEGIVNTPLLQHFDKGFLCRHANLFVGRTEMATCKVGSGWP